MTDEQPPSPQPPPEASLTRFEAVLFDLDGVITPTAEVHMRAWARLFEPFLEDRGVEPYQEKDYFAYIDGRPRYEGVQALLEARGIEVPYGSPDDDPDAETVCGLGNRKNKAFMEVLEAEGVTAYPGSVRLVDSLIERGTAVACVS
ncbi:HAD hydrolase-like protein, partial [Georgenia sp. 10Sc9-8]|nr:HAD hydrolase-like protein [Georgenia halotolerans]